MKEKEEAEEQTRKDFKNNRDGFHMTGVKVGTVGQREQCNQDALPTELRVRLQVKYCLSEL